MSYKSPCEKQNSKTFLGEHTVHISWHCGGKEFLKLDIKVTSPERKD